MTTTLTHFDLNAWVEYGGSQQAETYHFVVYAGENGYNNYQTEMAFEPTAERIARFRQLEPIEDDVWFGYDGGAPNELEYILFGTGGYVQ